MLIYSIYVYENTFVNMYFGGRNVHFSSYLKFRATFGGQIDVLRDVNIGFLTYACTYKKKRKEKKKTSF